MIWVFFRLRSSGVFLILSSLTKNLTHKMVTLKVSKALKAGCTTSAMSWIPSEPGPYTTNIRQLLQKVQVSKKRATRATSAFVQV